MLWRSVVLLVFAVRAEACMCTGNWPSVKQAWQTTPFVFLGTVEIADPDKPHEMMFQEQFVRIRVDEAFKGVTAGQTIELHLGATDCDAKFQTGQRAHLLPHVPDSGEHRRALLRSRLVFQLRLSLAAVRHGPAGCRAQEDLPRQRGKGAEAGAPERRFSKG
jgi:hypothetical protein